MRPGLQSVEEMPAFVRSNMMSLPREFVPPQLPSIQLGVWQSFWDDYATRMSDYYIAYKNKLGFADPGQRDMLLLLLLLLMLRVSLAQRHAQNCGFDVQRAARDPPCQARGRGGWGCPSTSTVTWRPAPT